MGVRGHAGGRRGTQGVRSDAAVALPAFLSIARFFQCQTQACHSMAACPGWGRQRLTSPSGASRHVRFFAFLWLPFLHMQWTQPPMHAFAGACRCVAAGVQWVRVALALYPNSSPLSPCPSYPGSPLCSHSPAATPCAPAPPYPAPAPSPHLTCGTLPHTWIDNGWSRWADCVIVSHGIVGDGLVECYGGEDSNEWSRWMDQVVVSHGKLIS